MQFDTKFKIGDKVRTIATYHDPKSIPCPFCGGKGYITVDNIEMECEMCNEDGIYTYNIPKKVWGHTIDVVGAAIRPRFTYVNGDFKKVDELQICVSGSIYNMNGVKTIPEYKLIFADEVEEGDPVDESYY